MSDMKRVQEMLTDVAKCFQEAHQALTMAKCRITAMAAFNRAQTMLDELEKHPDPEVARSVKEARKACRDAVGRDKSLHHKFQIYAAYWKEAT